MLTTSVCSAPRATPARLSPSAPHANRPSLSLPREHLHICQRCFSQTRPAAAKKKGKEPKPSAEDAVEPGAEGPGQKPKADAADPYSFDDIEAQWDKMEAFHADKLKKLRSDGRFNTDVIGDVPVQPDKKSGGGAAARVPLRDLAMVVHKGGRTIELRLYQTESKKAVKSAIQAHPDFNQQPQDDPEDEYVLYLRIEPERADDQARRIKDVCNEWREQVRQASTKRGKAHRQWRADKVILPDDLRLVDKDLQKRQDRRMASIDAKEKQALQLVKSH